MPKQLAAVALVLATSCGAAPARGSEERGDSTSVAAAGRQAPPPLTAEEKGFYRDMARASWNYLDANYQARTGLVNATPDWANTTVWDIGSQILAYYAAQQLGLIDEREYDKRIRTTLATIDCIETAQLATSVPPVT